jgi:hypothetical protein
MNSHPTSQPLRHNCIRHHMQADLLRRESLPASFVPFIGAQSSTLYTAIFDSVLYYGGTFTGIDPEFIAGQHKGTFLNSKAA